MCFKKMVCMITGIAIVNARTKLAQYYYYYVNKLIGLSLT